MAATAVGDLLYLPVNHDVDRLPAPSIVPNPGPSSVCGSVRSVSTSSSRHHEIDRFSSCGRDPRSECGSSSSSLMSSSNSSSMWSSNSSSDSSDSIPSLNALSLWPQSQAQTTQPQWNIRASVLSTGFNRQSRGTPSSLYALIRCTPEVANQSPRLTTTSNDINDGNKSRYSSLFTTLVGKASNEQALVTRSSSPSSSSSKALTIRAPAPLPASACLCDRTSGGGNNNGATMLET
ncbi:hypothetical protein B0O80DRAFT_534506 [Mortierella sp. GBAus27b]|nr:hypothetical protein B0O80DRAFT_534506 [Mortierella sp. GBAus27b]